MQLPGASRGLEKRVSGHLKTREPSIEECARSVRFVVGSVLSSRRGPQRGTTRRQTGIILHGCTLQVVHSMSIDDTWQVAGITEFVPQVRWAIRCANQRRFRRSTSHNKERPLHV